MTNGRNSITRTVTVQECAICGQRMGVPSEAQLSITLPERAMCAFQAHLDCVASVLNAAHREGFDRWREERRRAREGGGRG